VPVEEALASATLQGWEACGGDKCGRRFGWLEEGAAADIFALDADPREDAGAFRKASFVNRDGRRPRLEERWQCVRYDLTILAGTASPASR
jgi:imidazolonepropionase-like amidohydrolase